MTAFAGYEMPVQYPLGILAEHAWTRDNAGLFDISHMGQAFVIPADGCHQTAAAALEALVPADLIGLRPGWQRYTQLLNDQGGVIDDLMVARFNDVRGDGALMLIVNAARKEIDFSVLQARLPEGVRIEPEPERALLALQGPKAAGALSELCPHASHLAFMQTAGVHIGTTEALISRSGYSGEDGFEISVPARDALTLWQSLLQSHDVRPCGLGARDSLRLEAGLCLYGHELDETTSPVEAGLAWSIQHRRRNEGGFPGAHRIQGELANGPARLRVGIVPEGRAIAREGAGILSREGEKIGTVTSGGFSPTLKKPVAMGYVKASHAAPDTEISLLVRGQPIGARVARLPFVPHKYRRGNI
jgi:aminomethyltransferase